MRCHSRVALIPLVFLVLFAPILSGLKRPSEQSSAPASTIFTVPAGDSLSVYQEVGVTPALALSPTGSLLVYVGRHRDVTRLYLQVISGGEARALAGTEGAENPFFSPDGHWVGFFADGKLKKLSVEDPNSTPMAICDARGPRGASWGDDRTIVFSVASRPELLRVSADGGEPQPVTRPTGQEDFGHRWPQVLPGSQAVLFTIDTGAGFDNARIAALSLKTGEIRPLIEGGTSPSYAAGHLVFERDYRLLAARFDVVRLEVTGPAVSAPSPVSQRFDVAMNTFLGVAHFSLAHNGSLAYISQDVPEAQRTLVWVDRKGTATPISAVRRAYREPRLSPDGAKVALVLEKGAWEVWTYEFAADRLTPLSEPEVDASSPTWSADSRQLTFSAKANGSDNIFRRTVDGRGSQEQLLKGRSSDFPAAWSPDGQTLAFTRYDPPLFHIWVFGPGREARPLIRAARNQADATFSPDGRWIAYMSSESGRSEVYVQPYPGPGDRHRVSSAGGRAPAWSSNGRELFYCEGQKKLMSVPIGATPTFNAGPPSVLFEGPYVASGPVNQHTCTSFGIRNYDVARDGTKFIMVRSENEPAQMDMHVVPDWLQQLPK